MRRVVLAAVLATAVSTAPAQAKPLLGINGDLPRFTELTGQDSRVHQAFIGWGQGQTWGSPFATLLAGLTPIPMLHLGTDRQGKEAITPAQIAAGAGDPYLIALNQAIRQWNRPVYIRPMAEMNNYKNLYAGFDRDGAPRPGHSPADFRRAFARISVILHGGSARAMNARLRPLRVPLLTRSLPVNPFPRLRILWSPLAGGNPRVPGNQPQSYYPGILYVDVEGGDIFDETLGDTGPWSDLESLYVEAVARRRPFSVPEWGLFTVDDPAFVQHMCRFLAHPGIEEAAYYDSRLGSVLDLAPKRKSLAAYRACVLPQGAPLPFWTTVRRGGLPAAGAGSPGSTVPPGSTVQPGLVFLVAGGPKSPSSPPVGADQLDVNLDPQTGVIANAFWVQAGKALGPVTPFPPRATGLVFRTKGSASPAPLTPPANATGLHVVWDPVKGTILKAQWFRVGSFLAAIPVSAGQTAIALEVGG